MRAPKLIPWAQSLLEVVKENISIIIQSLENAFVVAPLFHREIDDAANDGGVVICDGEHERGGRKSAVC